MESCKFYFHKRETKKDVNKVGYPIRLHFHYGGMPPFRYSTGEKWIDGDKYWDKNNCRPIGKSTEAQRLRNELQKLETGILGAYSKYKYLASNPSLNLPKEPSAQTLLEIFLKEIGKEPVKPQVEVNIPSVAKAFEDFFAMYQRRAKNIYESTYASLERFIPLNYPGKTIHSFLISNLNDEFISHYKTFLYSKEGLDLVNITANNYLSSFRLVFKELLGIGKNKGVAAYRELNLTTHWLNFDLLPVLRKNTKFYLTGQELYLLHHTYFWQLRGEKHPKPIAEVILPGMPTCLPAKEYKPLRLALDMYLFCTDAPLRISDMQKVAPADMVEIKDGQGDALKLLALVQTKTQNPVNVVLSDRNLSTMEKYSEGNGLFPKKAHTTIQKNVKTAFKHCPFLQYDVQYRAKKGDEIITVTKKKWDALSFHTSRNTFTTLGLLGGAPLTHIRDTMGHTDTKTTLTYDVSTVQDVAHSIRKYQNQLFQKEA